MSDEIETRVIRVAPGGSKRLEDYSWNTPGSHDYKSEGFSIERVEDARGVAHTLRWADEPLEIFPGCRTEKAGARRYLVVSSSACPVRALHVHWFQYSGSHPDHSHSWRKKTWYRFELDSGGEG